LFNHWTQTIKQLQHLAKFAILFTNFVVSLLYLYIRAVSFGYKTGKYKFPGYKKEKILMKKILIVVSVVLVALVIFGAGFVFSQYQSVSASSLPQGYGPGGMMGGRGGYGPMHDYVEQALATKLGLTEAQVEEQLAAGKSMYQIALDKGIAEADVPALLTEVHKTAFAKAVADGVLTQAQADTMLQRMSADGFDQTNCPMGGARPQDGTGYRGGGRRGAGGMMGGWNQQPAATQPAP
jgi:hypothetical protein